MRKAKPGEFVALDFEMFGMSKPHRADGEFACLSIAFENGDTYQIYMENEIELVLEDIQAGTWVMQNALFDLRLLRRFVPGLPQRFVHDTMLMDQDMFGGWYSRFDLANIARRYLGVKMDKEPRKKFADGTMLTPEMQEYAIKDAYYTALIAPKQVDMSYKLFGGIMPWYVDIDEPAMWAILDMPPVKVDREAWKVQTANLAEGIQQRQDDLGFNVNSHKIVKEAIEDALGKKIRNTNAKDTLEPLLTRLSPDSRAAKLIREVIEIRELRKAVETYGESWIEQALEEGDYVFTDYHVTGALTGRMASSDPNLQNIPARKMPIYRTFFIASDGCVMQKADVSQQEPWFSAYLSGDIMLTKELMERVDLHQVTADLFGVDRPKGKNINLGLNYNMSEYGLAARVGISVEEARAGIRKRERYYRQLTSWRNAKVKEARKEFKLHTVTGRPIWVNPYTNGWERQAVNGPIQGSAADHTKLALVNLHKSCKAAGLPLRAVLIVHDEIVQDAPVEHRSVYASMLSKAWDDASATLAPGMGLQAKVFEGANWKEAGGE